MLAPLPRKRVLVLRVALQTRAVDLSCRLLGRADYVFFLPGLDVLLTIRMAGFAERSLRALHELCARAVRIRFERPDHRFMTLDTRLAHLRRRERSRRLRMSGRKNFLAEKQERNRHEERGYQDLYNSDVE